jgi:hypothetical protein
MARNSFVPWEKNMVVVMLNYHVGVLAFLARERSLYDEDFHFVLLD